MLQLIGVYDYTVILTYLSLFFALFGTVLAESGRFTAAVLCLLAAGFCDAFDGIVARTKKNRTEDEKGFGIQLDSLCDIVSFGVFPALLWYYMGVQTTAGMIGLFLYVLCAVIRLAFFNVLETKRQRVESGISKGYRGLPVTSISVLFPLIYAFSFLMGDDLFLIILHLLPLVVGFLFILDFSVPKPDYTKLFRK